MRKARHLFSQEFRLEAVRMMDEGKKPSAETGRGLGIRRNQLYKWKENAEKHGINAFSGSGRPAAKGTVEEGNRRLKEELSRVKEEDEILKKAAAFFARELK